MGIRDLLRNLFGRNRSAEPNQEPESTPAEQHAAPQTAQERNETEQDNKDRDEERSTTSERDTGTDTSTATSPAAATSNDEAASKGSTDSTDSRNAAESDDADEDDDDPNRVPSPRFAADDVSKDGEDETSSTDDRAEPATSPTKTTSEDFLDSVAGTSHDESPDLSTLEPARPDAVSSNGSSATASSSDVAEASDVAEEAAKGAAREAVDDTTTADDGPEPEPAEEPVAEPEFTEPQVAEPRAATVPQQASEPTEATTRATTETSENATAAVSLEKVQASAPGLVSLYKAAAVSLEKRGLAGQRAAVYLVLDRSGSMRRYYKDGTVQHLAEQVLGLSAHLDDDGTVPVVFFSTDIDGTDEIDLANHTGRVEELHASYGHMGRTNYHRAVEAVIEHYEQSGATDPALVIFQTDGAPTSRAAAEKALCDAASKPLFWQFIGFGDPKSAGLNFLKKLDSGLPVPEKRAVDNAGFFHAGLEPRSLSDAELYDALTEEFPQWLEAVREAQIHA